MIDYYLFCNGGHRVTVFSEISAQRACAYLHMWHPDKYFSYCAKPLWDALMLQQRGIIRRPPNISPAPRALPPARERSA